MPYLNGAVLISALPSAPPRKVGVMNSTSKRNSVVSVYLLTFIPIILHPLWPKVHLAKAEICIFSAVKEAGKVKEILLERGKRPRKF